MIKNTPEQMDNYISRLKYQLDEVSRLESTRIEALQEGELKGRDEGLQAGLQAGLKEGLKEGEKRGELIGRIKTFQELLGITEPLHDQLSDFDFGQLAELCEQLRLQLRSRNVN